MKGYWDHKGKPSMFVVKDGDKEIYRGGFKKGYELLMNTEPKNNTIEYLRKYNEWRRGADTEQPDPKEAGEQIDAAIAGLTMLEETAKLAATLREERDEAQHEIEGWRNKWECAVDMAAKAEIERDEARAFSEERYGYWQDSIKEYEEMREKWRQVTKERDEARKELDDYKSAFEIANRSADDQMHQKRLAERERDEAKATLTDIHRWIERNHPDGVIDSLSYLRNLERVTDRWYERLDKAERERDEAREERDKAIEALMKIEEIFVDGCDTFADRQAMGEIARAALEGKK